MSDQHDAHQKPEQSPPEDDDNILDELKAQLFTFAIYGIVGLFFYGFVQFLASFEPKVRLKYDDIPLEQRLENLPPRFTYFYQQAQLGFADFFPIIKYWDFKWQQQKMSYKVFQFNIAEKNMTEPQFIQHVMPRLIAQEWTLLPPPYEDVFNVAKSDFVFVDKEYNHLFVSVPRNHQQDSQNWRIYFVENSGIYKHEMSVQPAK